MTTAPARTTSPSTVSGSTDPLQLIDVDHVRFYVGNAKQAAHFYANCFGFQVEQYADLTTGSRDAAHYLLTQGNIRLIMTSGLTSEHPACLETALYGDGVKDVAFTVFDATKAYERAIKNGAASAMEPRTWTDSTGSVTRASIRTYGRCVHSFVSRTGGYELTKVKTGGTISPTFKKTGPLTINDYNRQHPCGLKFVDHLVGNVELGKMNHWVAWYENVMEFKLFKHFDDKDISTEYSALMSKVMSNGNERVKFPINEPAEGKRKSQIEEYLEYYRGPGVQHIALATDNIIETVGALRNQGIDFLRVPSTYYEDLVARVGKIDEPVAELEDLGILVDRDDEGYMLQIFTKPIGDRPTMFLEVIERHGARGFGEGNFKALFEAIEREQELRGNL